MHDDVDIVAVVVELGAVDLHDHVLDDERVHPERGEMAVEDQANMLLGHDLYHIEQLGRHVGDKLADVW